MEIITPTLVINAELRANLSRYAFKKILLRLFRKETSICVLVYAFDIVFCSSSLAVNTVTKTHIMNHELLCEFYVCV